MCLKYKIGSLKSHSKDAIYDRLDKTRKFSNTKKQCAQGNQGDFNKVVIWARRLSERSGQMNLDNVELLS